MKKVYQNGEYTIWEVQGGGMYYIWKGKILLTTTAVTCEVALEWAVDNIKDPDPRPIN